MLLYLTNTRPEIQFAVHQVTRFNHCPRESHAAAIYRICRYLKGTSNEGLTFKTDSQDLQVNCYVDADFAGLFGIEEHDDPLCARSRTGYTILLGKCPVAWVSRLQDNSALSTTEAEFMALSQAMRDLLPIRTIVKAIASTLGQQDRTSEIRSTVFEDNNACLSQARTKKFTPRNKHYATKYHFFRKHIGEDKGITLKKIDTTLQIADIFTKGLASESFKKLRKLLMGW
jgi:hypothetical protein